MSEILRRTTLRENKSHKKSNLYIQNSATKDNEIWEWSKLSWWNTVQDKFGKHGNI